jgi:BirA family biotin operon repressor/biotin-[acetyl-CoA-carboxylase] ligase
MLEEVDSTNRVARDRIIKCWRAGESAEGIAIVAARQSAGRGQHGRRWESPIGGLYMSMVIESVVEPLRERLALVAGWAVVQVIRNVGTGTGAKVSIRWPNDVLLNNRKVAGILCEGISQGNRWASIVGVGVNVKTDVASLPPELRGKATSLKQEGLSVDKPAMIIADIAVWMNRCLNFATRDGIGAVVKILKMSDALRDQPVRLNHDGQIIEGIGAGLAPDGSLQVRMADGQVRSFSRGTLNLD